MPFIGFELDAKKKIGPAARVAGIAEEKLGWGLIDLWSWCWMEKRLYIDGILLEAFFGGDSVRVARALEAFGFLEAQDGQWRVKGAKKYLRISEARSEAGKTSSKGRSRNAKGQLLSQQATTRESAIASEATSKPPAIAGEPSSKPPTTSQLYTEHRTPNTDHQKEKEPPARANASGPVGELRDGIEAAFLEAKGAAYEWTTQDENALRSKTKYGTEEILRRWRIALARTRYPLCSSVVDLVKKWNDYAKADDVAGNGPPLRERDVGRGGVAAKPCARCGEAADAEFNGRALCYPCAAAETEAA
jgi:hypothetical protein